MIYTANIIPTMTSPTAPSGVASASSEYDPSSAAWKAFDKAGYGGGWNTSAADGNTGWLQYQFPSTHIVTRYAITSSDYPGGDSVPGSWVFQGSNDGTEWVTLDTQTDITDWFTVEHVRKVFDVANTTPYAYYRLDISASSSAAYVAVAELEMMETVSIPGRWFRRRGRNGQPDRVMRMKGVT